MNILLACEESQAVTTAMRKKGHKAFSCDILPTSGKNPEWHLRCDINHVLDECWNWDMIIAFPPCTYLTVSNNGPMARGCSKYTIEEGKRLRQEAIDFFMLFANHPCKKKAIENPIGIMSSIYRTPDQYIQPNEFGHDASKKTCLWLFGLPKLKATKYIPGRIIKGKMRWANQTDSGQNKLTPSDTRATERSKTYQGIADAMADQWT